MKSDEAAPSQAAPPVRSSSKCRTSSKPPRLSYATSAVHSERATRAPSKASERYHESWFLWGSMSYWIRCVTPNRVRRPHEDSRESPPLASLVGPPRFGPPRSTWSPYELRPHLGCDQLGSGSGNFILDRLESLLHSPLTLIIRPAWVGRSGPLLLRRGTRRPIESAVFGRPRISQREKGPALHEG